VWKTRHAVFSYAVRPSRFGENDGIKLKLNHPYLLYSSQQMPYADANGGTLVPLRLVGDLMGASVNWDRKEQKAIVAVEDETIVLFIGKDTALVNNQQVKLNTKPVVQNETAMVPLRFLSEVLKINIRYIKDGNIVELQDERLLKGNVIDRMENEDLGFDGITTHNE
jgi:hypothetical protein